LGSEKTVADAIQLFLNFAWAASALALVALSLGLIFGELKIVNIAQGDLMMVGAYAMYALRDLPFLAALAITLVFGFVFGLVLERGILRWVYDKGFMATLLASWGIGLILEQIAQALFTATEHGIEVPVSGSVNIAGVAYPLYRLLAGGGMIAAVVLTLLLVYRTPLGLRLRASIDNVEMAAVLGISAPRMFAMVFALATALAVFAGALVAPTIGITPTLGLSFLAPAFFAVLIARQGSVSGPVAGAVLVQIVFTLLQNYLNVTVAQVVLFALLALLVAVRPRGISWSLVRRKGGSHGHVKAA
jgi:branched-chain amino acid transport system permease protein/urea transport system permease protein